MIAWLRTLLKKPLTIWQSVALYAGIIVVLQIVKANFPEQTKAFTGTFFVPLVILLAVLVGWGLYKRWRRDFAQPTRRR